MTPLHVAAASNNSSVVEILASNGGLLEATTFYMLQTPLHYAARYNSPSSVKKLVEMGAVLEARYVFYLGGLLTPISAKANITISTSIFLQMMLKNELSAILSAIMTTQCHCCSGTTEEEHRYC